MQKIKKITKYFVPALFVLVIIATLAVSVMFNEEYTVLIGSPNTKTVKKLLPNS